MDSCPWRDGSTMASPPFLCSPLLPSSCATLLFLRKVSFSGVMPALVRMPVPGAIGLVRVHGTVGLAGLLGWVNLIDQLYCRLRRHFQERHGFWRLGLC